MRNWTIGEMRKQTQFKPKQTQFWPKNQGGKANTNPIQTQSLQGWPQGSLRENFEV